MRIESFHHVQLAMPAGGEERARAFYAGVLGIPETPKPDVLARRGGAWFERDGLRIHLGVEEPFRPARKAHPALLVDGLDELIARLHAAGAVLRAAEELDGFDRVYAEDPFGNRLEFIQRR